MYTHRWHLDAHIKRDNNVFCAQHISDTKLLVLYTIYAYIHAYIYVCYIYIYIHAYIHAYVCVCVWNHLLISIKNTHTKTFVCAWVYAYIYTHSHTHTHTRRTHTCMSIRRTAIHMYINKHTLFWGHWTIISIPLRTTQNKYDIVSNPFIHRTTRPTIINQRFHIYIYIYIYILIIVPAVWHVYLIIIGSVVQWINAFDT